jgi:hypothetical protein
MNKRKTNNIMSKDNKIEINIPYYYLVYGSILFVCAVVGGFSYFSYKIRAAQEKINSLQLGLDSIQKSLLETNKTNQNLEELISKLNLRNEELTNLISKLSTENESLLVQINTLKNVPINSTPFLTDPVVKLFLGVTILSITTIGGYYLVSVLATKLADSSVGWFLSGIDAHLKNLGNKVGIFNSYTENTYTFKDSVNREYVINILDKTPNSSSIQIKSQGELIDIGNYISELLNKITSLQNSIPPIVNTSEVGVQTIMGTPGMGGYSVFAMLSASFLQVSASF